MNGPGAEARRRGPTRWVLLAAVAGLAVLVGGITVLEARAPENEPNQLHVPGVPPLADREVQVCTRQGEDTLAATIRAEFPAGGRVSATQVYACPSAFDGLRVVFVGEVIGELLVRDGGAWAQINDDDYALKVGPLVGHREQSGFNTGLAVWLPDGLHEGIEGVGRFRQRGDVVLLEGVIHRADPNDGGGLTLRADLLETLAPTVEIEDPLHQLQAIVAAVLAALALASLVWVQRSRQR